MRLLKVTLLFCIVGFMSSCGLTHEMIARFPSPDDVFITSGDGDITKPYTPVGQLYFSKVGTRIPLPILGLIPLKNVDPDETLKKEVLYKIKEMGGDGLINMKIDWTPPSSGFLGLGATGGGVIIYGTVIKR